MKDQLQFLGKFLKILIVRLFLLIKYCSIMSTLCSERLAFSKGRKGGLQMTIGDAILNLVDKLLAEREKVLKLELSQQYQLNKDEQLDKD